MRWRLRRWPKPQDQIHPGITARLDVVPLHRPETLKALQQLAAQPEQSQCIPAGVDDIWQASLRNHELRGSAALLQRIVKPCSPGEWSHVPIDCRLSSHPRPVHVVEGCTSCELLAPILGERPEHLRVHQGGGRCAEGERGCPLTRFWSGDEQLRQRYRDFRAGFDASQEDAGQPHNLAGDGRAFGVAVVTLQRARPRLRCGAGSRQPRNGRTADRPRPAGEAQGDGPQRR